MGCCVRCRVIVAGGTCNCKKPSSCPSDDQSTLLIVTLIVLVSVIALGVMKAEEPKKPSVFCCCWFNCQADSSDFADFIKVIILKVAITAAVVLGGVFACVCSNNTQEAQSKACDDCYNEKPSFHFLIGLGVAFGLIFLFYCFSSLFL